MKFKYDINFPYKLISFYLVGDWEHIVKFKLHKIIDNRLWKL